MADVLSLEKARQKRAKRKKIFWLCVFGLLMVGVLLIYLNRDSLRNFDAAMLLDQNGEGGFPMTLPSSNDYEVYHAGSKLLLLTDTYLNLYNGAGKLLASIQHGMNAPCVALSDTRCALYVQGTQKYILVTLNTMKYETYETESPIALISCADTGQVCTVESGTRYVSELITYNPDHEEVYRWQTQQLVTAVSFCSANTLAVVSLDSSAGGLVSQLNILPLYQEEFIATLSFPSNMLLSLDCKSNGNIVAVGDTAAVCVSIQGDLLSTFDYGAEGISYCENSADTVLLVLGDYVTYKSDEVVVLDRDLQVLGRQTSDSAAVSLTADNDRAAVLFEDTALWWHDGMFEQVACGYGYLECELYSGRLLLRTATEIVEAVS